MKQKKEPQSHIDTIDDLARKTELIDAYETALITRTEDIINGTKFELQDKYGKDYLNSLKGQKEYGKLAAKKAEEIVIREFNLNSNKFNEKELSAIVKTMYRTNQKTLTRLAQEYKSKLDHEIFKKEYLKPSIDRIKETTLTKNMSKYDLSHGSAILKHICHEEPTKYFNEKLISEITKNRELLFSAIMEYNSKGQTKLGLDYFKNNNSWSLYLHDKHKK